MPASIPTKGIADLLLRAGPMVERTAGSAVRSSSMAPKMARAMRGCALRAPFAASSVPLVASGENRQSNHLGGPSRKVSGLRPSEGHGKRSYGGRRCRDVGGMTGHPHPLRHTR